MPSAMKFGRGIDKTVNNTFKWVKSTNSCNIFLYSLPKIWKKRAKYGVGGLRSLILSSFKLFKIIRIQDGARMANWLVAIFGKMAISPWKYVWKCSLWVKIPSIWVLTCLISYPFIVEPDQFTIFGANSDIDLSFKCAYQTLITTNRGVILYS